MYFNPLYIVIYISYNIVEQKTAGISIGHSTDQTPADALDRRRIAYICFLQHLYNSSS